MISSKPRFKYLIFSALLYAFPTNAICYWPNGDTTPQDVACRDDSDNSACCSPGFACLDNGLCMTTRHVNLSPSNVTYVRGSCTDQTWKSSRCPNYCVRGGEPFGDIMDGMQGLANCNNTSGAPEYYCVDLVGGNCTAQENLIAILSGKLLSIRVFLHANLRHCRGSYEDSYYHRFRRNHHLDFYIRVHNHILRLFEVYVDVYVNYCFHKLAHTIFSDQPILKCSSSSFKTGPKPRICWLRGRTWGTFGTPSPGFSWVAVIQKTQKGHKTWPGEQNI